MSGRRSIAVLLGVAVVGAAAAAVARGGAPEAAADDPPADEIRRHVDAIPSDGSVLMYGPDGDVGPLTEEP